MSWFGPSPPTTTLAASDHPEAIQEFTQQYCIACHGPDEQKGDLRIDSLNWDLTDSALRKQWNLIHEYIADQEMPPKKAKRHPNEVDRSRFLAALDSAFVQADRIARPGGTPLRRLNRVEYLNTVRDLFGFRMLDLPLSFPADATQNEFDTMPAGMFLSPAVMEGYHEMATLIADRFAPLPNPPSYRSEHTVLEIGGDATRRWFSKDKDYLKFIGFNIAGWTGALWDSLFAAPASGVYRVRLLANAQADQGADGRPLRLAFYAFDPNEEQLPKRYRREWATLVAEVDVPEGVPSWIECDVPVEEGETFHVYCANRFPNDHFPGGDLNRSQINGLVKQAKREVEPTIELRGLTIEGPIDVPPRARGFFGNWPPKLDRSHLRQKLLPLASRAFRRPLSKTEEEALFSSVLEHGEQTGKPEYAWHYAIRRILCSPDFLYREAETSNTLTDFALASRLSYFLWSTSPDEELHQLATDGKLKNKAQLEAQTRRLLSDARANQFVKNFAGQWLGNRTVASINVCDNRYQWDDNVRYGFVRSTELFFAEILKKNLPITTFIESDFTYANSAMQLVWGMKPTRDKNLGQVAARQRQSLVWPEPERLDFAHLPEHTPAHVRERGGVLGLPGVLTLTGDGVESSPILRGVWVLENLFGQHPPPPPKDVPALDIDTSKATSVRETLKAHTEVESCAKCHRDIDPLGLALENYDAIGGWRTHYPSSPSPIDSAASMPDGTQLKGARSIKQFLLDNPAIFTRCLLTKLLEYGAGRTLTVGDQQIVKQIVAATPENGYGIQDLILTAITSEVFLAK